MSVTASASFEAVLEQLATKGLHRVYVTDLEGKPTSVITLTDVLRKVGAGVRRARGAGNCVRWLHQQLLHISGCWALNVCRHLVNAPSGC